MNLISFVDRNTVAPLWQNFTQGIIAGSFGRMVFFLFIHSLGEDFHPYPWIPMDDGLLWVCVCSYEHRTVHTLLDAFPHSLTTSFLFFDFE